jgi:heme oxygenase
MTVTEAATSLMQRLKEGTWDLHTRAERHDLQQRMAKGELRLEEYVSWLGQMFLVHRALERRLRAHRGHRTLAALRDEQFQEPYLREDLEHFGVVPDSVEPLPATARLIDRIERVAGDPAALLGFHYVLEGSHNGNRFVAAALRRKLGLQAGHGDRYLDPYGEAQRDLWAAFKRDVDASGATDEECGRMVASARELFAAIYELSGELSGVPASA